MNATTPCATAGASLEEKPVSAADLLTPVEGAALLGLHPLTLRRYRHQGRLRAFRLPGGGVRYLRADLLALLQAAAR